MSGICRNQSSDLLCKSADWFLHKSNTDLKYVKRCQEKSRFINFNSKKTKTEVYSSKTMRVGNENVSYFFSCWSDHLFICLFVYCTFNKHVQYLIGEKKLGKVTKFLASDKIFLQLSFSRPVFFPDFFSPDKKSSQFFFKLLLILLLLLLLFPIILQNLLLPCFFDVRYLSWLGKIVLTKFSKCEWKWNWNWEWNWSRKSDKLKKLVE